MDATQDIEYQESLVFFANDDDRLDGSVQHFLQIVLIIRTVVKRTVKNDFFRKLFQPYEWLQKGRPKMTFFANCFNHPDGCQKDGRK